MGQFSWLLIFFKAICLLNSARHSHQGSHEAEFYVKQGTEFFCSNQCCNFAVCVTF